MTIYQATGDLRKVSLWLGHADMQTTEVYLRADPTERLEAVEAVEAVTPPSLRRGQFSVPYPQDIGYIFETGPLIDHLGRGGMTK